MNTCHYRNVTSLIWSIYTDKARANWCKTFRVLCKTGYLSRFIIHNDATIEFVTRRYSCVKVMIGEIYINPVKNLSYLQMLFYH